MMEPNEVKFNYKLIFVNEFYKSIIVNKGYFIECIMGTNISYLRVKSKCVC